MTNYIINLLEKRGINIDEMAKIVYDLQVKYSPNLTLEYCKENILNVLEKKEVQHAVLTGITIDMLAEEGKIPKDNPLYDILKKDEGLYGIDEIIALGIVNVYGFIGLTNFGYLDKAKPGIIDKINNDKDRVNVFLDDLVSAIIAAACGRIAHNIEKK